MADFKLLVDTNIVIALEDPQPVETSLAELVRLCNEHSVGVFVDGATYDDVSRDTDAKRRTITLSKLQKFQKLRGIPLQQDSDLESRFGPIKNEHDHSDVRLLVAVDSKAVDFLVTADIRLRKRADRASLGGSVLTVDEALTWLRQLFSTKSVSLPNVFERKAYELSGRETIFDSLRLDYPTFDSWFEKCKHDHRDCWVLEVEGEVAGLIIRKDEDHYKAGTRHPGPKILKICTFKVREEFQGEKFGELLLKQVVWYAQHNGYDLVYLTAFQKQEFLIALLCYYGFEATLKLPNGEIVLEKPLLMGPLPFLSGSSIDFDRKNYPRFHDGATAQKFCVPIRPEYHRRLFPEIAFGKGLPLFPDEFWPVVKPGDERLPGNTIRKVYLCRARTQRVRAGDILFFYMSKDEGYVASQSITTVAIAEQMTLVSSTEDLVRLTAKRSVFSAEDLERWRATTDDPVKAVDFLLIGHVDPPTPLTKLLDKGVLAGPPQSIIRLSEDRYRALKPLLRLGFDF
jgi:ribosomal protein S18 acetylase RimI-like enzyme